MEDPDRDWKPNGRPQSTIARNFMTELDDLFKIDGDLDSLDRTVHEKKRDVSIHTQQLEALEARLRETEERLKLAAQGSPPTRKDSQRRSPVQGAFSDDATQQPGSSSPTTARRARHNHAGEAEASADRPPTARKEEEERS